MLLDHKEVMKHIIIEPCDILEFITDFQASGDSNNVCETYLSTLTLRNPSQIHTTIFKIRAKASKAGQFCVEPSSCNVIAPNSQITSTIAWKMDKDMEDSAKTSLSNTELIVLSSIVSSNAAVDNPRSIWNEKQNLLCNVLESKLKCNIRYEEFSKDYVSINGYSTSDSLMGLVLEDGKKFLAERLDNCPMPNKANNYESTEAGDHLLSKPGTNMEFSRKAAIVHNLLLNSISNKPISCHNDSLKSKQLSVIEKENDKSIFGTPSADECVAIVDENYDFLDLINDSTRIDKSLKNDSSQSSALEILDIRPENGEEERSVEITPYPHNTILDSSLNKLALENAFEIKDIKFTDLNESITVQRLSIQETQKTSVFQYVDAGFRTLFKGAVKISGISSSYTRKAHIFEEHTNSNDMEYLKNPARMFIDELKQCSFVTGFVVGGLVQGLLFDIRIVCIMYIFHYIYLRRQ